MAAPKPTEPDAVATAEHVRDLAVEIGHRMRQELEHAGAELSEKISYAGRQTALVSVGAICSAVSIVVLAGAAVLALGSVLPMWVAALAIAAALAVVGHVLAHRGISALRSMSLAPTETLAAIREDVTWVEHEVHATLQDAKRLVIPAEPSPAPARRRRKAPAPAKHAKR